MLKLLRGTLSQTELARRMNIHPSTISKVESGVLTPSQEIVNIWLSVTYEHWKKMQDDAIRFNAMMAVATKENVQIGA
jgi:transcriptional regulator with XRE-family HTH domain